LEKISSLERDVGVYVGFARVVVNSKLLYKTVNIVSFAHKDNIFGGFVSWNDNVFIMLICGMVRRFVGTLELGLSLDQL